MQKIVIFKNDRIGDLMHSLESIYSIIQKNKENKIHIFLSELNYELKNLLIFENTQIHKISNKLDFKDKFFLFLFFIKNSISYVFILRPESFFFFLPLIFFYKKIKFIAICLFKKNYQRPNKFLRSYLFKYVINDRGTSTIRKPILLLQNDLIKNIPNNFKPKNLNYNKKLLEFLPEKYIFFHFNKYKYNERGWGLNELYLILNSLKIYNRKIVISNDINDDKTNVVLKKKFSYFENNNSFILDSNFFYLPNIKGEDFYNTIKNADLVVAFHGSITSIAAINNVPVLDIFHIILNSKEDFYEYKNAFHEFKFKKNNYEFTVPNKDINKTLKKINYQLSKGRKLSKIISNV